MRGTSHTVAGLQPATAYTARVRPVRGDRACAWSPPVTFTTAQPTPPRMQPVAQGSVTADAATVTWTASDPPGDVYDVEVTSPSGGQGSHAKQCVVGVAMSAPLCTVLVYVHSCVPRDVDMQRCVCKFAARRTR